MSIAPPELAHPQADVFPYETAAFHQCWWEFLAPKFDIPVKHGDLLIHRKPVFKGLLKLREARISGWNNAWNQDLNPARVEELIELAHTSRWDYFRMTWSEARKPAQAFAQLQEEGYPVLQLQAPPQHVADLSQGMTAYLQRLGKKTRKNLEQKTRQAQALTPTLSPCTEADEIAPFFAEFFQYHIPYWDEKTGRSYFNDAEERNFMIHWAKALHQAGQLRLDRLIMGGQTVNLNVGIQIGNTFYWLLTINTGLHADAFPGVVGLAMRIEQFAAQGGALYNMGAGDFFVKVHCATQTIPCHEVLVCNPNSLKGRAYFAWMQRQQSGSSS